MIVPLNYNKKNYGLTPGGHVIEILKVEEYYKNDNPSLRIIFDINEGSEYDGYFKNLFFNNDYPYKKWPNNGTKYLSMKVTAMVFFTQFIDFIEKSNDVKLNIVAGTDLDLEQFKGLKIGGEFGLVEYEINGELRKQVVLNKFKKIDQVDFIKIPPVRLLDGSTMDYDIYMELEEEKNNSLSTNNECDDEKDQEKIVDEEELNTSLELPFEYDGADEISF